MTDATPLRSGLSDEDIALEFLAMGLRPSEGIARDRYAALFGKPVSEAALSMLIDAGLVLASASHISLTDKGRLLADYVSARLI